MVDSTSVSTLKHQVHILRYDLAEKKALLATVQKKLNRHRPQYQSPGNGDLTGTAIMTQESTTGKVIGNLRHEIESLKKEVADAKTQIHICKVARDRADRQVQDHAASHQTLQLEIESLKGMLERKERQVRELEESTKSREQKKTDMRTERDESNTKLKQSEIRAVELQKQLIEALACREQAEMQYKILSSEMESFKKRYVDDVELIKREYKELREEMSLTAKELQHTVVNAESQIVEMTEKRQKGIEELSGIHQQLKVHHEKSTEKLTKEIEEMKVEIENSNKKTSEHATKVAYINHELTVKLKWMKNA
ncbi:10111_t:CDS:2 [Acaulospora morrowiae]|uniref:SWI5-dependent HO expression protein 3 n=1 Tax=Acaulospora morrowiae TaxID=94023 RepID=A0A9N9B8U8_9GLOM|nr:10111_t:CDS:2 [Acaulospora morrowiae]